MDTELSVDQLVRLAFTASHLRPARIRNVVLPGGTGSIGGLSVVTLSMSAAQGDLLRREDRRRAAARERPAKPDRHRVRDAREATPVGATNSPSEGR